MKKFAYLVLALVMIMGTMGIAYAKWSDQVTMRVNASTDSVKWCFQDLTFFSSDACDSGHKDLNALGSTCLPTIIKGTVQANPPKDVACTDVTLVDCQHLSILITNAYPFYESAVNFTACNEGSIPVKICSVVLSDGINTYTIYRSGSYMGFDLNKDKICDMLVWWGDSFGDQFEPQECADVSIHFAFLEDLPQSITNGTLTFTATMNVIQWNEYDSGCVVPID